MSETLSDRERAALVDLAGSDEPTEAELQQLLAEQREVASIVRAAALEERAPLALRTAIEQQQRRPARRRRRFRLAAALGGATAVAAASLAFLLGGASEPAPSLAAVVALAARTPATAAPAPLPVVDDVRFPDWDAEFGWRAVGTRTDRIDGHRAVTVVYAKGDRRATYTIVAGDPLPWSGDDFKRRALDGRTVVTWRRDGRTCVLSATGVPGEKLLALAAWDTPIGK